MLIIVTDQMLDSPGPHILYVNKRWQEVTGYTSEEAIGKTPRILQGEKSNREALTKLKKVLEKGERFEGSSTNYRKDGTPFVMTWIVVAALNEKYYVALQKVTTDDALEQLEAIKKIQLSILEKLDLTKKAKGS